LILLGALSIAIVLIMPQGLWGLWRRHFSVGLLPIGHRAAGDDAKTALPIEGNFFRVIAKRRQSICRRDPAG
jgi:hypothetical protein